MKYTQHIMRMLVPEKISNGISNNHLNIPLRHFPRVYLCSTEANKLRENNVFLTLCTVTHMLEILTKGDNRKSHTISKLLVGLLQ